jgi:hypothetical protein
MTTLPDLESLACVDALSRTLRFHVAARARALSPAAFSKRVQQVEEHVGAPLFARTTRNVELTDAGEALKGLKGAPGHDGEQGAPGARGEKGEPGLRGEKGDAGPIGERGEPGPIGPRGEKGIDGKDGRDGISGKDGSIGPQGPAGETGERGEIGPQGEAGPTGPPGAAGDKGIPGPTGEKGQQGEAGPRGEKGDAGIRGEKGDIGPGGPEGLRGEKGLDGSPGPAGRDGRDGSKGDPGRDGKDGKDGITTADLEDAVVRTLRQIKVEGRKWHIGSHTVEMPVPQYMGVWRKGDTFGPGDMVTWGGAVWHCNAATDTEPQFHHGDDAPPWTLAVKAGRDGRDGKRA